MSGSLVIGNLSSFTGALTGSELTAWKRAHQVASEFLAIPLFTSRCSTYHKRERSGVAELHARWVYHCIRPRSTKPQLPMGTNVREHR